MDECNFSCPTRYIFNRWHYCTKYCIWDKRRSISMSKIIEAAKKSQLDEFIKSTENGYRTFVGERGIKLMEVSAEIGIAGALYKNLKF